MSPGTKALLFSPTDRIPNILARKSIVEIPYDQIRDISAKTSLKF